ncbi:hypothetical protein PWT90_07797 [Aphanocladium album]|nr:hypothetical protein PWT90_07797 [Aphanocladium album]
MSPKSSLVRSGGGPLRAVALTRQAAARRQVCAICSMSGGTSVAAAATPRRARNNAPIRPTLPDRRQPLSTAAEAGNVRAELEQALVQLQSQSPRLFNLSRLQLALQGLRQAPGEEAVRVAILGLAHGASSGQTAKRLLRAILSDPLQDQQAWETQLDSYDLTKPLVVKISAGPPLDEANIDVAKEDPVQRLHISSPGYDALGLEFLLLDVEASALALGQSSIKLLEDAALVPSVATRSADGRISQTPAPVHQALIVADGLMGAVGLASLPISECGGAITTAVDMKGLTGEALDAPFSVIDVAQAEDGVRLFREGPQNAMQYERLWFASKVPALTAWLKAGLKTEDAATKPAVKQLLASLLENAQSAIQTEESIVISKTLTSKTPLDDATGLHKALAEWARQAHSELTDQLDLAFTGRRWRKLGWWKLFWRVDDVGMLTSDILSQRFLPTAERELVYLAGRIAELRDQLPQYPQPASELPDSPAVGLAKPALPKWPGHIAFTRRYLQEETVPALQALAQRLLVQSLGTSGVATTVAGLLYVSSFTSGFYEAGAIAALGIVYSLGRMQKKWETARRFWEGDVREEGRKAVRAVEESVSKALAAQDSLSPEQADELQKAKELVSKAAELLSCLK